MGTKTGIQVYRLVRRSTIILLSVFFVVSLVHSAQAEPLSKSTVIDMLQMYNSDKLTRSQIEAELEKWGIDFQLSEENVKELTSCLDYEKGSSLIRFMKDEIAPLTFNGQRIKVTTEAENPPYYGLPSAPPPPDPLPGRELPRIYPESLETGFSNRTYRGRGLQLDFFLKNTSTKHRVNYRDVYLEILGVSRPGYGLGPVEPSAEPISVKELSELNLCPKHGFVHKSLVDLIKKDFLKSDWCMIAKDRGEGSALPPDGRQAYKTVILYRCSEGNESEQEPFLPGEVLYVRFVVPYDFKDGVQRFVRSDKFYRMYWEQSDDGVISITEYPHDLFFDLVVTREPNGYAIRNAFDQKQIAKARNLLEKTAKQANRRNILSGMAFHSIVALRILGSEHLLPLAEAFVKEHTLRYGHNCKEGNDDCWQSYPCHDMNESNPDDITYRECGFDYIQLSDPVPRWENFFFYPYYLKPPDPRVQLFSRVGHLVDFGAHFAILYDILKQGNSTVLSELQKSQYDFPWFLAFIGDKAALKKRLPDLFDGEFSQLPGVK